MYKRVGRTLLMIGQHYRQKLCENTKKTYGISVRSSVNNYVFRRTYCTESSDESENSLVRPSKVDEEATTRLKDYLAEPDHERMYKIIELEIEVLRQNSDKCPSRLRPNHWWELLQLKSQNQRRKYLAFLWAIEMKKQNELQAKIAKRKLREEAGEPETNYRLGKNSQFLRIYETTINRMYNSRLMNAMLYGQPIVLDCSYETYMTRREVKNCAKQLQLCFATNRIHDEPFDLHLCNVDKTGELEAALHRYIPTMYDSDFPLHIKTESYLDIFDKDSVVYLTPHCSEEMTEFDHNAVYIIGAFVDKSSHQPVSLAKAKKLGLKMKKLPLDRHLQWGNSSSKNLTINAVLDILLDLRITGSWNKALEHVPRRKLWEAREAAVERQLARKTSLRPSELEIDSSAPMQHLGFKDKSRFNNPKIRVIAGNKATSSYNRVSNSNIRPDLRSSRFSGNVQRNTDMDLDFSVKGRAKVKRH